jgi:hypothetical protein
MFDKACERRLVYPFGYETLPPVREPIKHDLRPLFGTERGKYAGTGSREARFGKPIQPFKRFSHFRITLNNHGFAIIANVSNMKLIHCDWCRMAGQIQCRKDLAGGNLARGDNDQIPRFLQGNGYELFTNALGPRGFSMDEHRYIRPQALSELSELTLR